MSELELRHGEIESPRERWERFAEMTEGFGAEHGEPVDAGIREAGARLIRHQSTRGHRAHHG